MEFVLRIKLDDMAAVSGDGKDLAATLRAIAAKIDDGFDAGTVTDSQNVDVGQWTIAEK